MPRLDALLEILGPGWMTASGSDHDPDHLQVPGCLGQPSIRSNGGPSPTGPLVPAPDPQGLGRATSRRGRLGGRGHPGAVGTNGPGLRGPRRRHRHRSQHRPGALPADRPPRPPDTRPYSDADTERISCRSPGSARSSPPRSAADSGTPPVHQPGRGPVLLRARPQKSSPSGLTDTRRPDQTRRRLPTRRPVPSRRPGPRADPHLAARYQRLMCQTGRHHNSAPCTIAGVLLPRIVACLRNKTPYQLRDVDGTQSPPPRAGRSLPSATRYPPRSVTPAAHHQHPQPPPQAGRAGRQGVAKRSR